MRPFVLLQTFAFLSIPLTSVNAFPQISPSRPDPRVVASYGKLPLSFEVNQGQTDPSVQYLSLGQGYTLLLRPNRAVFALRNSTGASRQSSAIDIALAGANPNAAASREDPQITRTNYFLGNNPALWKTGIPNYGRIRYRSVYDGVDLLYYGNQHRLEHDFIVAPHADPSKIVLSLNGARRVTLDPATGDLILALEPGQPSLRLLKPFTYQQADHAGSHRIPIDSSYRLLGENRVTFTLGRYNHARPLIIDPVLVYSTYLGGSGGDQGNGIALDSAGDAYVVGTTFSTNFPVTSGSFQTQDNAVKNEPTVFISKLNPTGTALVYSTFLGGSGGDYGYGIALDAVGDAYVTGATYSTDFPVTCTALLAANPSKTAGAPTAFVAELTANGDALTYSTYLGGSGNQSSQALGDVSQAIALDTGGNAYVTGYTYSPDFPVSDAAFQPMYAGTAVTSNAFVAKLSPGGTSLLYATYLGGSGVQGSYPYFTEGDYGNAIAVDGSGDAYIAGSTASGNFPVTASAFQGTLHGPSNAFVTELNPAGASEVYSTYLGGSGQGPASGDFSPLPPATGDTASAIAIDANGNAYVAGTATSYDFPITAGVLEGASDFDGSSGFVTKLNQGGSTLAYSTYLEGVGTTISGLAIDSSGAAYVTGNVPAVSASLPAGFQATSDALPTPSSTQNSAFVIKLNPAATELNYATLLGGSSNDGATALALDSVGDVFVTGSANSADFPTTPGAFQTTNQASPSNSNAFVSEFALAQETGNTAYPVPSRIGTTLAVFVPAEITLTNCDGFPGDNAFYFSVGVSLTPSVPGPPPTGFLIFTDSFNYNFPLPYQLQLSSTWGSGPGIYPFVDGESYDGPIGPFSISWTAYYYGDAVYDGSSTSGTASSPGCPATPGSAGVSKPKITGPHIEFRSEGVQGMNATAKTPAEATGSSVAPKIVRTSGAKFTPAPASPQQNASALHSLASSQPSPACLATPQVATPSLSLSAGTYTSTQTVTITDATTGAAIYYTTDGSTPTTASTLYSGSISVSTTETVDAIATAAGYSNSAVASAAYTITRPAASPIFSPQAGTYTSTQTVIITDATPGAAIYYTTDGSTPTTASTLYPGSISVATTETISAIATATGYTISPVASVTYTITPPAAMPVFSPSAGTYTSIQSVAITDATAGATIYYTADGSTPTTASTPYSGSLSVSATETLNAIAIAPGYISSPVASATYTINLPPPAFSISVNPTSLTISPGQTGTAVISIAPQNGFASATTFSCSGLPSGVTCSFSPASVTPSGGTPATTTLTISASSTANLSPPDQQPGRHLPEPAGPTLALALAVFGWRRRRSLKLFVLVAVATCGLALFSGCGGSSAPKPVNASVSVIATSGAIQQTVPLTVTIQ